MEEGADDFVSEIWLRTGISPFGIGNMKRDVEMIRLPPGKNYHLYVVHSKEDTWQAVDICRQLKIRFRLKCLLSYETRCPSYIMLRSLTIMLLLSPAFLNDVKCGFQMRLAFQLSVDQPFNLRIIKVLLQDVDELPPSLEPYSCIDAQKTCDLIAEINEGLQGMRKK